MQLCYRFKKLKQFLKCGVKSSSFRMIFFSNCQLFFFRKSSTALSFALTVETIENFFLSNVLATYFFLFFINDKMGINSSSSFALFSSEVMFWVNCRNNENFFDWNLSIKQIKNIDILIEGKFTSSINCGKISQKK